MPNKVGRKPRVGEGYSRIFLEFRIWIEFESGSNAPITIYTRVKGQGYPPAGCYLACSLAIDRMSNRSDSEKLREALELLALALHKIENGDDAVLTLKATLLNLGCYQPTPQHYWHSAEGKRLMSN